jgi:hypothetical protein
MSSFLTPTNGFFNLTYTLTEEQIADTITIYPDGYYYLFDVTDSLILGYNTLIQNQYSETNINITNENQLVFNNRFVPSRGDVVLQILFSAGVPSVPSTGVIIAPIIVETINLTIKDLDPIPLDTSVPGLAKAIQ